MQNAVNAALASWAVPPWATCFLLLTSGIYIRGWRQIRRTRPYQFPAWRLWCFLAAVATVWLAIASPLDTLSGMLLSVHMVQHLLLMSLAPPLVALGAPQVPMLRGLPRLWVREGLGPFFTTAPVQGLERLLKSRPFAWLAMNAAFLGWHLPAAYDLALRRPLVHEVEHACFFLTSLLFWWPIIEPWPVRYKGSRWMLLPYLLSADIINTSLSAFLTFSGRVVYPVYADAPRLFGFSALSDQIAAGSLMWVLGSSAFLGPAMWITFTQVSRRGERREAARRAHTRALQEQAELVRMFALEEPPLAAAQPLPQPGAKSQGASYSHRAASRSMAGGVGARTLALPSQPASSQRPGTAIDLFAFPWLVAFFKSRYGRQSLQAVLLLVSAAIVVDGFCGHQMASMNLAGVVPWTYARALFVLALLTVGNLFCMSCPFMLPRELAKKLASALGFARRPWPRALRNKWFAVGLLGLFFWAYEAFALWDSPLRTAAVLLAYFVTVFVLDSIFRGAAFCKYVCPVGQFNFVSSLVSPLELKARSQATCAGCATRDCIAGNQKQRGCELDLFMPLKGGNLDCTLCMDCVKACPHDNIGLFVQPPAQELVQIAIHDPQRSSVGRYARRPDVAALAILVVSAAFGSAAVMVTPVASLLGRAASALPAWLAATAGLVLAASAPAVLFGLLACAVLLMQGTGRPGDPARPQLGGKAGDLASTPSDSSLGAQICRWSLGLLPVGLCMWASHLCFHLATAWGTLGPAAAQALHDLETSLRLHPANIGWVAGSSPLAPDSMLQVQLAILDAGLLFALYLGWRIVRVPGEPRHLGRSLTALAPWASVVLLLYGAGVWVLLQPMQMRGMAGM